MQGIKGGLHQPFPTDLALSYLGGKLTTMAFTFIDLFAGIGGFHAALAPMDGRCVMVSEIDAAATAVYHRNWGSEVDSEPGRPVIEGDIAALTDAGTMQVPQHDVLAAGFPCQPFSKSGRQMGINELRGTLFFNIARVLEERKPAAILLENVRNLAGPRHADTWATIVRTLRMLGYRVSSTPTIFSPHLLPPEMGGTPQWRERVFILGTYVGRERAEAETDVPPALPNRPVDGWDPLNWDLEKHLLQEDDEISDLQRYMLTPNEVRFVDVWDDFVRTMWEVREGRRLPGFPLWADHFEEEPRIEVDMPSWKKDFLRKNSDFYIEHKDAIDAWKKRHGQLDDLPPSRRKFEWQAQDTPTLWDAVMHFRPSGIRAKRPTYLPALVAITQTSIVGSRRRRITPREAARLQGLPDWFDFGDQSDTATYKQLGNGVAVGAARYVFQQHVLTNREDLPPHLVDAVLGAGFNPDLHQPTAQATIGGGSLMPPSATRNPINLERVRDVLSNAMSVGRTRGPELVHQLPDWVQVNEQLRQEKCPKTLLPVAMVLLTARVMSPRIDVRNIKARLEHGYNAGTISLELSRFAKEQGLELRSKSTNPMNSATFLKRDRIHPQEGPLSHGHQKPYFDAFFRVADRINALDGTGAAEVLALFLFLSVKSESVTPASFDSNGMKRAAWLQLSESLVNFVDHHVNGGRTGQAFVGALFDLIYGEENVQVGGANDPDLGGKVGDVLVGSPVWLRVEVRQRPVTTGDITGFGDRVKEMGGERADYFALHNSSYPHNLDHAKLERYARGAVSLTYYESPIEALSALITFAPGSFSQVADRFVDRFRTRLMEQGCDNSVMAAFEAAIADSG